MPASRTNTVPSPLPVCEDGSFQPMDGDRAEGNRGREQRSLFLCVLCMCVCPKKNKVKDKIRLRARKEGFYFIYFPPLLSSLSRLTFGSNGAQSSILRDGGPGHRRKRVCASCPVGSLLC
jgi:hypothetical protein